VEALLDKGAKVNTKDKFLGMTALMWASGSVKGHQVVQLLLARGAEVNAGDDYGLTALMRASRKGHREIVQALLAKGADVNAKDKEGRTALMWASRRGHREIQEMLIKAGAKKSWWPW
jgi:ankyrin repeat protein